MATDKDRNEKGQFQVGNDASTKKWSSPEELKEEIDKYFDECDNTKETVVTKEGVKVKVKSPIPYTIEGLCDVLDCDRNTLLNYQKKEGYEPYFRTIKRAKNKIARKKLENGLTGKSNSAVTIFDLKNNHGYKDKTEVDQTVKDVTPPKIEYYDPKGTDEPEGFDIDGA